MSVFKCKMCGGTLEVNPGESVAVCEYCGTKQTLPRLDDDRRANLYDRAGHFRRNNEYDKAAAIYEQILEGDNTDAEAYWSLVLCRYGIEYVEDPAAHKRIPTVNRAQFTSVLADEDYKSAIKYADTASRGVYEAEARTIDEIQRGILAISQKEEPFDIFICYKETDASGRRTPDSVLANELYHQLTKEGFKVFFSRITLEDKLGTAYEPYIFAALNSANVMVVLGTKQEYFNAVWVKNEWSRYLSLVKKSGGEKLLIPAYRDMDPYDLPEEFSHLQAQDMAKLGFMQDLIHGIKKIVSPEAKSIPQSETVVVGAANASTAPLLERVAIFLEDGKWQDANTYCEKVLDIDPKNAEAYLGKLMAELKVGRREDLKNCEEPFDSLDNFGKVIRFGDKMLAAEMNGYIDFINERKENARLEGIYIDIKKAMQSAQTESDYLNTAEEFKSISGYKDASDLAEQCVKLASNARKDAILAQGKRLLAEDDVSECEKAITYFENIRGWKDADEKAELCRKRIDELKEKAEQERLERERRAEEERLRNERLAKRNKKIAAIATPIICAAIIFSVVLETVIIPNVKYNKALNLMKSEKYEEAISAFQAMDGYKDSVEKIEECKFALTDIDYNAALELMNAEKYDEAIAAFNALNGFKDSRDKVNECENAINDIAYNAAVELMNAGKYDEAVSAFEALNGYKDSNDKINECKNCINDIAYNAALELMNAEKYEEAISAFEELNGYKDSNDKINECENSINDIEYNAALVLMNDGKYEEAITAFSALEGYKDSAKKVIEIHDIEYNAVFTNQKDGLKEISVGKTIKFGLYEQDNYKSNGKEEIEWKVLTVENGKALLISKYALDCVQYNTEYTDVTWETCSLRKWLNNHFLNESFGTNHKNLISLTNVSADKNPSYDTNQGNATQDKVFLLSINEANKYFDNDDSRICATTAYAKAQGAWTNRRSSGEAACWWWLRSPGSDQCSAAGVSSFGGWVDGRGYGVSDDSNAVRPAMWINLP